MTYGIKKCFPIIFSSYKILLFSKKLLYSVYRVLFSLLVVKASGTFYPLSTLPTEHIQKSPEYKNNITGTNVLTFNSTNALMLMPIFFESS